MPRFILEDDFNTAFRKKPAEQSKYDLEVIAVNERVQIFYGILRGNISELFLFKMTLIIFGILG